jgi:uncharacterized protein (TIGR02145 family)
MALDIRLSGTVTDASGNVLPGAGVSLAGAGAATTSNSNGTWNLSGPSGIALGSGSRGMPLARHLVLDGKRIRLRFDGVDASGRASAAAVGEASTTAVRSMAAIVDTLLYSWRGRVLVRVGISSLVAGDLGLQAMDTSTRGTIVHGGQEYKVVRVGSQTWMAENLNVQVDSSWWYEGSASNGSKYGRLYPWAAMMDLPDSCNDIDCERLVLPDHQGICPTGWHVPSEPELGTLADSAGGSLVAATRLKSTSGWIWLGNGNDSLGFRALPAGYRNSVYGFMLEGEYALFWSSSAGSSGLAWYHDMRAKLGGMYRSLGTKRDAHSVRCLKN